MPRNNEFTPGREPLHYSFLSSAKDTISGPFGFLNPTQARYVHNKSETKSSDATSSSSSADDGASSKVHPGVGYQWSSRNNRKGRHALTLTKSAEQDPNTVTPRPSSHPAEIARGIWRMLVQYPIWDVSFDVAYIFTWGSVVWVINAFFSLLPYVAPSTDFPGEVLNGGGISAFIGATIFEIGSVLLMIEAVNENRSACFGWALEKLVDGPSEGVQIIASNRCTHHHQNKGNLVGSASADGTAAIQDETQLEKDGTPPGAKSWIWYPSWNELKTHYLRELGFLACSSQMFGATIFWISGFTALPGINNKLAPHLLNGIYWVPQIIGGSGFVVSGTLFMIEVQKHWWQPAPKVLGWWIGLWNLIGGIGFTICPIFGLNTASWSQQQAAVSTFWGSWAFLIGSMIQWYESLDKYPVLKVPSGNA